MSKIVILDHKDIHSIKALLSYFDLPITDLESAPIYFRGIKNEGKIIATGALEIYETNAILRSIAVHKDFQKLGYGNLITQYLEHEAIKQGVRDLYLLTTTAASFFQHLNYIPTERDLCPDKIKSSQQFRELCPNTAVCLFKRIKS